MILFPLLAVAVAAPFSHGPSIGSTYAGTGDHQALRIHGELPLLYSPPKVGRIPGPPAWQWFGTAAVTGRYDPGSALSGGISGGTGLRHVRPFGWKLEATSSLGVLRERRIDGDEPKASTWAVPRAALHIGRDDWLPYHSRISWHAGPMVEAKVGNGEPVSWTAGAELGFTWRVKAPR